MLDTAAKLGPTPEKNAFSVKTGDLVSAAPATSEAT